MGKSSRVRFQSASGVRPTTTGVSRPFWRPSDGSGPTRRGREHGTSTAPSKDLPAGARRRADHAERTDAVASGAGGAAEPDWVSMQSRGRLLDLHAVGVFPSARFDPRVFEQIVGMWLRDVVQRELPEAADTAGGAGLLGIPRGGQVVEQDAARGSTSREFVLEIVLEQGGGMQARRGRHRPSPRAGPIELALVVELEPYESMVRDERAGKLLALEPPATSATLLQQRDGVDCR